VKRRTDAKRVALINHKGGVGKTTLTINLAIALCELGKRVLIVDADPQCNVTAHFLPEDEVDELLDKSESETGRTIWTAVRPLVASEGDVREVKPYELYAEGLFLLAGDIRLAELEEELTEMWGQCFRRKVRGIKGTTGLSRAVHLVEKSLRPDFIFYDTGPNIGPLNRVVALDCSHFVTPVACDLFSLRALKTLGHSLAGWIHDWQTARQLAPDSEFVFSGQPRFIGYVPQSFRIYDGEIASNSRKFIPRLERQVRTEIVARLKALELAPDVSRPLRMASIKHFGQLVPQAQHEGTSLWDIKAGGTATQQARTAFRAAATELIARTESK
jgi:cellulose biosynthesis protein BcsQ